jgi:hypothetical protein
MSDCQRCAALRMIAEDATLSMADMVQLARDALASQPPCQRREGVFTADDYAKVASMPEPSYNPDDPDNPMLDILMPKAVKHG